MIFPATQNQANAKVPNIVTIATKSAYEPLLAVISIEDGSQRKNDFFIAFVSGIKSFI
jgi:hypothetical protein